jgi:hypothetical protein
MVDPLFERAALVVSGVVALMGPLGVVAGYRNYTDDQRRRTGGLYHVYLLSLMCVTVVGTASFVLVLLRGAPTVWLFPALTLLPLPVALLQWKLQTEMGYSN